MEDMFKFLATVKLGTHRSAQALLRDMSASDISIGDWTAGFLNNRMLREQKGSLDLFVVYVYDLGLKKCLLKNIYKAAKERGFDLCPAEAALQLCRQPTDQQNHTHLAVAMKPIKLYDGKLLLFDVYKHGPYINLQYFRFFPDHEWCVGRGFVFAKRTQAS